MIGKKRQAKLKKMQKEYNKFIATLRELSIEELLLVFIEAKTGSQDDIEKLPVSHLKAINELGDMLNTFYADRVIDSLFKKD